MIHRLYTAKALRIRVARSAVSPACVDRRLLSITLIQSPLQALFAARTDLTVVREVLTGGRLTD